MYLAAGQFIWRNDSLDAIVLDQDHFNSTDLGWQKITQSNVASLGGSLEYRL